MIRFYGEELLAPRPTSKLEDHPLSAACYWLFNTFPATLHIGDRSPLRNLRIRHSVLAGIRLSWEATTRISLVISVHPSLCLSLCLSAWNKSVFTERSVMKLVLVYFTKICRGNSRFINSGQEYQVLGKNTSIHFW